MYFKVGSQNPTAVIDVSGCCTVWLNEEKTQADRNRFVFSLGHPARQYHFSCSTRGECQDWVDTIQHNQKVELLGDDEFHARKKKDEREATRLMESEAHALKSGGNSGSTTSASHKLQKLRKMLGSEVCIASGTADRRSALSTRARPELAPYAERKSEPTIQHTTRQAKRATATARLGGTTETPPCWIRARTMDVRLTSFRPSSDGSASVNDTDNSDEEEGEREGDTATATAAAADGGARAEVGTDDTNNDDTHNDINTKPTNSTTDCRADHLPLSSLPSPWSANTSLPCPLIAEDDTQTTDERAKMERGKKRNSTEGEEGEDTSSQIHVTISINAQLVITVAFGIGSHSNIIPISDHTTSEGRAICHSDKHDDKENDQCEDDTADAIGKNNICMNADIDADDAIQPLADPDYQPTPFASTIAALPPPATPALTPKRSPTGGLASMCDAMLVDVLNRTQSNAKSLTLSLPPSQSPPLRLSGALPLPSPQSRRRRRKPPPPCSPSPAQQQKRQSERQQEKQQRPQSKSARFCSPPTRVSTALSQSHRSYHSQSRLALHAAEKQVHRSKKLSNLFGADINPDPASTPSHASFSQARMGRNRACTTLAQDTYYSPHSLTSSVPSPRSRALSQTPHTKKGRFRNNHPHTISRFFGPGSASCTGNTNTSARNRPKTSLSLASSSSASAGLPPSEAAARRQVSKVRSATLHSHRHRHPCARKYQTLDAPLASSAAYPISRAAEVAKGKTETDPEMCVVNMSDGQSSNNKADVNFSGSGGTRRSFDGSDAKARTAGLNACADADNYEDGSTQGDGTQKKWNLWGALNIFKPRNGNGNDNGNDKRNNHRNSKGLHGKGTEGEAMYANDSRGSDAHNIDSNSTSTTPMKKSGNGAAEKNADDSATDQHDSNSNSNSNDGAGDGHGAYWQPLLDAELLEEHADTGDLILFRTRKTLAR